MIAEQDADKADPGLPSRVFHRAVTDSGDNTPHTRFLDARIRNAWKPPMRAKCHHRKACPLGSSF